MQLWTQMGAHASHHGNVVWAYHHGLQWKESAFFVSKFPPLCSLQIVLYVHVLYMFVLKEYIWNMI